MGSKEFIIKFIILKSIHHWLVGTDKYKYTSPWAGYISIGIGIAKSHYHTVWSNCCNLNVEFFVIFLISPKLDQI